MFRAVYIHLIARKFEFQILIAVMTFSTQTAPPYMIRSVTQNTH